MKEDGSVTFIGDWRQGPGRVHLIGGGDLGSHITALQLTIGESSAEALEVLATLVLDMVAVKVTSPDGGITEALVSYQMVNDGPRPPNLHLFGIIRERYPDYYPNIRIIRDHSSLEGGKVLLHLDKSLDWTSGSRLEVTFVTSHADNTPGSLIGTLPPFQMSVTDSQDPASDYEKAVSLAVKGSEQWSEEERNYMREYFRAHGPRNMQSWRDFQIAEHKYLSYADSVPSTWAVTRIEEPREIRVLPRGNWQDDSGPVVQAATPHILGGVAVENNRATRLDLARWLVSEANPLTGRAQMNRLWAQFFGAGISRVVDDLGVQGNWPSHPDLLDWLAVEFRESGWDMKRMVRLIVTSSSYRQSSQANEIHHQNDPENRIFARQVALPLPAEIVRDNALAISGLLNPRIGGPSVRPYQPEGYYSVLNFPRRVYNQSSGDLLYRRGIYVHWQRTRLHPFLRAFDAPSRQEAVVDRPVSNTPLQALALLNDPSSVEFARAYAGLLLGRRDTSTDEARLAYGFERATARRPIDEEMLVLHEALIAARQHFRDHANETTEFLKIGESIAATDVDSAEFAAWISVARIILNLHETNTRL